VSVHVIGLGSPHGDDGLGWAALDALARRRLLPGLHLHARVDPATELLAVLGQARHAILVDAIVDDGPEGRVVRCGPEALQDRPATASSHGVSVDVVLALARALGTAPERIELIGLTVRAERTQPGADLSPAIRAALPALVDAVLAAATEGVPA
jgi:hydrogenase maturation protease